MCFLSTCQRETAGSAPLAGQKANEVSACSERVGWTADRTMFLLSLSFARTRVSVFAGRGAHTRA